MNVKNIEDAQELSLAALEAQELENSAGWYEVSMLFMALVK